MIPLENLLAFALAAFVLIVVPGPSVLFVVSRTLALGRKAGIASVIGNATGEYLQVIAVGVGVGAIVERSVTAFTMMKFCGAAYLIYLGVRTIRDRLRLTETFDEPVAKRNSLRVLREGFVVGVTNPKSVAFFVAVLPHFVERSQGQVTLQLLTLGIVFVVVALLSDSVWVLMAGTAREWFARSPQRLSVLKGTGGLVMIGLGVQLALLRREH